MRSVSEHQRIVSQLISARPAAHVGLADSLGLVLADDALTLTRIDPWGKAVEEVLEPFFTRVELEETPLGDALLFLSARGRRLRVGQFLSAPERREVGALIREALARYRNSSTSAMA